MKKYILLILGIIFIFVAFITDHYSILRIISLCLGILLIVIQFTIYNHKNIFIIIVLPIVLLLASYGLDCLLLGQYNRLPIFVYEIKSSDKVKTYNSFFYRIFNCDGTLELDYGYQDNYLCDVDDLVSTDINAFLSETLETYKKYHSKFVKLDGKISKISGIDIIEMSSYDIAEDSLNGYVNFKTSYTVRIKTQADLTNLRIYDKITVIGLVNNLEDNNGNYIIDLTNAIIIPSTIYDVYSFEIVENESNELIKLVEKQNYYLYGLDNIFVHYDTETRYELSYLITDSRITLEELIKDKNSIDMKNEEEVLIAKKYELDKFDILVCENDKVVFGNKKKDMDISLCE